MRVFITGANGYIGGAVAQALKRRGHSILALARNLAAKEYVSGHGYKVIEGSLQEPKTLADAVRDAEAVIHCAATGNAEQGEVDIAATRAMLDALRGTGRRFIYTSGCWLYGNTGDKAADESSALAPAAITAYRAALEREVIEAAGDRAHTIVLRPGVVFGQRRGLPAMIAGSVDDGAVQFVGDGSNRWPLVYVEDLAELYALALEKSPSGQIYNGGGPDAERVRDIASAAAKSLGLDRTNAIPLEAARDKFGVLADALALDQVISSRKAKMQLGWMPSTYTIYDDFGLKR